MEKARRNGSWNKVGLAKKKLEKEQFAKRKALSFCSGATLMSTRTTLGVVETQRGLFHEFFASGQKIDMFFCCVSQQVRVITTCTHTLVMKNKLFAEFGVSFLLLNGRSCGWFG